MERVKFPSHCSLMEDSAEIERGGWREAVVSGGDHLKRVLEEYGELGFDCLLEEMDPAEVDGCTECYVLADERMYRVYVRPGLEEDGE